ncbi:MAG: hypothetical protein LC124_07250 [Ignavibacteriales bacterium]|jgi:hypothetical protein|nr:hypothetical protein [Ignavibacteriales bacterium]MDX9712486.1 hypothetical protein [Ignavibacteriaceae bacterium]
MNQLELFEKTVQIKMITHRGRQIFYLAVSDVKQFMSRQCNKFGLWLYVDGVQRNPQKVNIGILSSAKEIILTQPLVGG